MEREKTRAYWLEKMLRIAEPVLSALAKGELRKELPESKHTEREVFAPLEAFGRTACGIAPWLALEGLSGKERELQKNYIQLMQKSLEMAVNPESKDYMGFCHGAQELVDTAFLAHAMVRAPKVFINGIDGKVKQQLIAALKSTRTITPCRNNWLLFSAMVEGALFLLGEEDYDKMRVDCAMQMMDKWYCGDGAYGDGDKFHWDYYNSFVIQPMMVDLVRLFKDKFEDGRCREMEIPVLRRAARYAEILERLIAPDGSYPAIGRSLTYRFGAFQMLSQAVLEEILPDSVKPAQVRCALTAVIERTMQSKEMFDEKGWLRPGIYGFQPGLMEGYINTGSLYLCTTVFLALGLPPSHPFWQEENEPWTSVKVWGGVDMLADHAIDE